MMDAHSPPFFAKVFILLTLGLDFYCKVFKTKELTRSGAGDGNDGSAERRFNGLGE